MPFRGSQSVITGIGPPTGQVQIGAAEVEGVSTQAAASDHIHSFPAPPGGYATRLGNASADGAGTTPAREDHAHALGDHLAAEAATAPAVAAAAGSGATSPAVTGTDARGELTWGTGAAPAAGDQLTVAFNRAYATPPTVVVCPANAAAAALQLYVDQITDAGFHLAAAVAPGANLAAAALAANYVVIG